MYDLNLWSLNRYLQGLCFSLLLLSLELISLEIFYLYFEREKFRVIEYHFWLCISKSFETEPCQGGEKTKNSDASRCDPAAPRFFVR